MNISLFLSSNVDRYASVNILFAASTSFNLCSSNFLASSALSFLNFSASSAAFFSASVNLFEPSVNDLEPATNPSDTDLAIPLPISLTLSIVPLIPSLTAVNAASAPFVILSQSNVNTPAITSPAPLATPIRILKLFINVLTINSPTANREPYKPVNTPVSTPTVLANPFITFSLLNRLPIKSANNIAIGSNTANNPFIILVNPSVILVSFA